MKKIIVVIALLAILVCSFSVTALAATIERELKVGEDLALQFSDTPYVSSDPSVVEVRHDGGSKYTAIAVGTGTATLTGATWMDSRGHDYVITVTDTSSQQQLMNNPNNLSAPKAVKTGLSVFTIVFIAAVFVLIFASLGKARKLDEAICNIQANPCQETAEAAIREFAKINKIVKLNLSMGGDSRGTHFRLWREVFNGVVIPCNKISDQTKNDLRLALMSMTTHGLREVIPSHSAEESYFCAQCGKPLQRDEEFCTKCGQKK